jgi:membrane protease YdiL (CAAX protease family)
VIILEEKYNELIDWNKGATLVSVLSILFGIMLGLPMLLGNPSILMTTSIIFYIILFIFATVGHFDDISKPRLYKKDVLDTLIGGLFGFLIIQVLFLFGLTMLRTPDSLTLAVIDRNEAIMFNLGFVVPGEELIFRDTLPFILFIILRSINIKDHTIGDQNSLVFAFLTSSVFFGLLHFSAYNFNVIALVQAVIAGIVLSIVRIKYGIGASFMAHAVFNVLNLLGFFILPIT